MRKLKTFRNFIPAMGCILSFFAGIFMHKCFLSGEIQELQTIEAKAKSLPATVVTASERVSPIDNPQPSFAKKTHSEEPNNQKQVRIPKSLALTFLPTLLADNDKQVDSLSLFSYGLPAPESAKLLSKLNNAAKELHDLESKFSSLVTEANGDQYIKIDSFSAEGQQIKAKVDNAIDQAFAESNDDRAEILKAQLFKTRLYSDFGLYSMELSIDEQTAPTGQTGYVFTTVKKLNGAPVDRFSNPFELSLMEGRYSEIISKLKIGTIH